jgi:hypothetical protein
MMREPEVNRIPPGFRALRNALIFKILHERSGPHVESQLASDRRLAQASSYPQSKQCVAIVANRPALAPGAD